MSPAPPPGVPAKWDNDENQASGRTLIIEWTARL
jgi:hypothetical protein